MRPGAVAAILLPEGPRLRMKQIQGRAEPRGTSYTCSAALLSTQAGVRPHKGRGKVAYYVFVTLTMCLHPVAGAVLSAGPKLTPLNSPFDVAASPPLSRERLKL